MFFEPTCAFQFATDIKLPIAWETSYSVDSVTLSTGADTPGATEFPIHQGGAAMARGPGLSQSCGRGGGLDNRTDGSRGLCLVRSLGAEITERFASLLPDS
jgi:hypothetical protein